MRNPLSCLVLLLSPALLSAQQELEFSGHTWVIQGDAKVETYMGQEALLMRSAAAILKDSDFENGTIEYDVAVSGLRSFVGVAFRADMANSYEDFYIRPHQTGRFDAIQYTPVYGGVAAWQLYPEYNATLDIPRDQWVHVKLVISGSRMTAFFDNASAPNLLVDLFAGPQASGFVALKSNFPAEGQPADLYPTAFANVVVEVNDAPVSYDENIPPPAGSGFITQWAISPAFPARPGDLLELPTATLSAAEWKIAASDSHGRVNLAKYRALPPGGGTVLARVVVRSELDQVKQLNFGFSDKASIFLNGQLLLSEDNTYRSRSMRYLGVMTIDNDAILLHLQQGENELVFAVSEAFGGWGVTARFENMEGIAVEIPTP